MQKFFKTVIRAIRDPSFYRETKNHTPGRVLGYLVCLILLSAFIATTITVFRNHGFISKSDLREVAAAYPSELEVRIERGEIRTNVPSPYFIDIDPGSSEALFEHFVTIDTDSNFSPSQLEAYKSLVLVSRDGIGVLNDNQIRFFDADIFGDRVVNSVLISKWLQTGERYLWIGTIVIFLFIWIVNFFLYIGYIVIAFLIAFLVMLIGKVKGTRLSYGESLRIALYAVTLPILLDIILLGFRDIQGVRTLLGFPFFSEMVWLGIIILHSPDSRPKE